MDDAPTDKPARRRIDVMRAMMAVVTVASIGGIAWLRYGPTSSSGHSPVTELAMDSEVPPLRLLDLKTSEPLVLFGLGDRVVWVVFWSAGAASGRECLEESSRSGIGSGAPTVRHGDGGRRGRRGRSRARGDGGQRGSSARLPGDPRDAASVPRPGRRPAAPRPDRRGGPRHRDGPPRGPAHDRPDRRAGPPTPRKTRPDRRDPICILIETIVGP